MSNLEIKMISNKKNDKLVDPAQERKVGDDLPGKDND